jgi:hypothetical protein
LEGGLPGWVAHGGRLTATLPPTARILTSQEARLCATRPGWIVAMPDMLAERWQAKEIFADLLLFSSDSLPFDIAGSLSQSLSKRRLGNGAATSTLHVLVVTESGDRADLIAEALQPKAVGSPVFALAGGLRGYLEHLRNLTPPQAKQWTTLADYGGYADALADLRTRQRHASACSSCSR